MLTSNNETVKVDKISLAHRAIYTDIIINGTTEQVWSVLTDTESYENWAAFLIGIKGAIKNGETITTVFRLNPEKEKLTSIEHTIAVEWGSEFYWTERGPGGIVDNHHFRVEPVSNGKSRFIQTDEIKKGITWLAGSSLSKMYAVGYQVFNRSLKAEVEHRYRK